MNKPPTKVPAKLDPRFAQAVQNFEAAMKALQGQRFERAKALLEKVLDGPSQEYAERARVYLNICNQQLARSAPSFKTPEEHYDYAVALMNNLDYDGARSHLEKILKQHPKADYAVYGLAVLECLQGRVEESLRRLEQAIRLNPNNRIQARNDSDLVNMADDPRFTELVYPEPGDAAPAAMPSEPKKR
jgi:tetratricopeptide (TPR) repeat protein